MRRRAVGSGLIVVVGAIFLFGPLVATFFASIDFNRLGYRFTAYRSLFTRADLRGPLWLSLQIALLTTALGLVLMLPTVFWLHLKVPRARPLLETVSIMPYVISPIILVVGIAQLTRSWPEWLVARPFFLVPIYTVTCLSFLFRSIDAGMQTLDPRTLTEAARNCGASWSAVLRLVVLPNLRTAILGAMFLSIAVVLGEFTIASLLLFKTFPVFLAQVGQSEAQGAAALSLLAFVASWIVLLVFNAVANRLRVRVTTRAKAALGAP